VRSTGLSAGVGSPGGVASVMLDPVPE